MNILVDATTVSKGGGVSTHIIMILKNFTDKKNNYFVLINKRKDKDLIERNDFTYITVPFFNRFTKFFYEQLIFPFLALILKVDLFYMPKQSSTFLKFYKTVSTVHDFIPEKKSSGENIFTRLYWKIEYNLISKKSDGIIFITKNCKNLYSKRFKNLNSKKSRVIYNGFDTYRKYEKQNDYYILIPSTLKSRKNIPLSLKLANDLKKVFKDKKILITGRMDDRNLKNYVENYDYRGYISFSDFERIMNDSFLIVYLSDDEGFSLPVAEGIHLGKKVLCMDIPVHREIYKDMPIYYISDLSYRENFERIVEKVKGEVNYEEEYKRWKDCSEETEEFFRDFKK
ncbi:MAG: glycosyltransferase [bacterium]|uniref:Glycosyl transferase, group 1 n=2 Tax=Bacteria candidate phyla TaxID=1783234 RepID=A0A101I2L4_UNCT6|nr:MAG: Glycosyl transferase, group 1 [candidate division TA06 bacterium 32_111]KUK87857.1 MAG: Glycosyl transferase, group 1 [candidate division TA06 bacterium 34_109]MDI6700614.1 glycosyltransferase [bacterium]HAF08009.1 hypothetical protein [candidate division WOR-3 bacterium]HCP16289.1 hypothetical protein [candidate division WOR-3 bacterium]